MRRLIQILIGFIAAMLAAAVVEVLFAQPPTQWIGRLHGSAAPDELMSLGELVLKAATHSAIFSALFALIIIVIGEWQQLREWTYYTTTGIILALGGFLAQYASEHASQPTILNNYGLIAFMTVGAAGGLMYWIVAGRNAGRRRRRARINVAADDNNRADGSTDAGAERARTKDDEKADSKPPEPEETAEGDHFRLRDGELADSADDRDKKPEASENLSGSQSAPPEEAASEPAPDEAGAKQTPDEADPKPGKAPEAESNEATGTAKTRPMTSVPITEIKPATPRIEVAPRRAPEKNDKDPSGS